MIGIEAELSFIGMANGALTKRREGQCSTISEAKTTPCKAVYLCYTHDNNVADEDNMQLCMSMK